MFFLIPPDCIVLCFPLFQRFRLAAQTPVRMKHNARHLRLVIRIASKYYRTLLIYSVILDTCYCLYYGVCVCVQYMCLYMYYCV